MCKETNKTGANIAFPPRANHPNRATWMMILSAALLAGCATPPDLGARKELVGAAQFETTRSFADATSKAWPADMWWSSYGDSQLTRLIDEALLESPSLAGALARVQRARALAQQAGAPLLPSITAKSGAQAAYQHLDADNIPPILRALTGDDTNIQTSAELQLSYQLDFFGRNRAALAAATSSADAAATEAAAVRLQLSTAVASSYAELIRQTAERDAARETVRVRQDSAELVRQRFNQGLENEGQASQADSELARARANLAAADGAIARTRNALAALLGKGPDRGLTIEVPTQPLRIATALPADAGLELMGRRPDLAAARSRAEAAASRIKVAKADFYPNVSLGAVVGLQTLGIQQLGGGTLTSAQVGPAISLPIFAAGRIEGAYRVARADYDDAVANYDQAVATAFREVADAMSDRRALEGQLTETRAALKAGETAYRLIRLRYEQGLASYIEVLTIENGLVAQRHAVADLEAKVFAVDIALVRALGGGFTAT